MESKYRSWIHEKENPSESVDSIEDLRRELQTTLGTTKWQVISISSIKFLWFLILVEIGFSMPPLFVLIVQLDFWPIDAARGISTGGPIKLWWPVGRGSENQARTIRGCY